MKKQNFIVHDFNLPNHSNELSKAESIIEKHQQAFKVLQNRNNIEDHEYTRLFEETIRMLDYLGRLSTPAFAIRNELEELYFKKFIHSPELAKKLWLDHYKNIHHPYNLLKNRCFKLLEDLDELYINVHNKYPPNWEY